MTGQQLRSQRASPYNMGEDASRPPPGRGLDESQEARTRSPALAVGSPDCTAARTRRKRPPGGGGPARRKRNNARRGQRAGTSKKVLGSAGATSTAKSLLRPNAEVFVPQTAKSSLRPDAEVWVQA